MTPVAIDYQRRDPRPRGANTIAHWSMVIILASLFIEAAFLLGFWQNLISRHLFCCDAPLLGRIVYTYLPMTGAVGAICSIFRAVEYERRGVGLAITTFVLGLAVTAAGTMGLMLTGSL